MFLRCKVRRKDGKQHRYWSVVENTRVAGGRAVQRHVLYLGEVNDSQELAWGRSIEVLEDGAAQPRTLSLFPEDRVEGLLADASVVGVKLPELRLRRPRQWGACWLALMLWPHRLPLIGAKVFAYSTLLQIVRSTRGAPFSISWCLRTAAATFAVSVRILLSARRFELNGDAPLRLPIAGYHNGRNRGCCCATWRPACRQPWLSQPRPRSSLGYWAARPPV
jgi:hypothetical protein